MRHVARLLLVAACGLCQEPKDPYSADTFAGLTLRSIGPALLSGRVTSFAVNPANRAHYFVGVASGGVWKTENAGVTFTPVFDGEGSYSIGHVVLDPRNPNTVWVGTGENNSQRSVSYGDGVYCSRDGGKSWKNVGLKSSEHIGRIAIDPRNSNVVYVAAQGPLWGPGGDRGLYKTTDGGVTWKQILSISENTGVTDVAIDPSNPDVILAAAFQRRRHVWTLINGGPESALYKSRDGGATFAKITSGLPREELGRISFAFSPAQAGLVYARVEAANKQGGVFRSTDSGESWTKRSGFESQPMYYGQIIPDPVDPDRVILPDVYARVSEDGGRTMRNLGDRSKHVDTHTFWIDPKDPAYHLTGCDGGVYESFDRGANWLFKANLPTMQFYDVTVDNSTPYYYVYGGTQDNNSVGGPSRTRSVSGITNADWFVTRGGDGFHVRVDPTDPNIVYTEAQYGALVRFDRRTGERTGIQPMEGKGEPALRWNWDSPLILSPHMATRLYFGANRLFRSDDRGDAWRPVSPDLTRQLDRNALPVMGRVWGPDAVAKNQSTSAYGNLTALSESPKKEGLLYAGTDDGLIQVSDSGGKAWRRVETFPGVPDRTYVARLLASQHDDQTVYAAFDNHKNADFKPYLLKSVDRGVTWKAIASNLPENGPVLAIAEDHVNPNLLFAGTEFGLYFTLDGGGKWIRLKGGLPTIAVRDLAIQKRENDLVLATFGRGFYILDDYTPLRTATAETLQKPALLFPAKTVTAYVEAQPLGYSNVKGWQGEGFYTASNPPLGATFTYYLKDTIQTKKERRRDAEKQADKDKKTAAYPTREQLVEEAEEEEPAMLLTVTDAKGRVIRRVTGPAKAGIHRVAWDLRTVPAVLPPPRAADADEDLFSPPPAGHLVPPGTYKVELAQRVNGVTTSLGEMREFRVEGPASLIKQAEFLDTVISLQRANRGALDAATSAMERLAAIKRAVEESPADLKLREEAIRLQQRVERILKALRGDQALASRYETLPPSVSDRIGQISSNYRSSTAAPTRTDQDSLRIASEELKAQVAALRTLVDDELRKLERQLDAAGVPYTPGRLPELR